MSHKTNSLRNLAQSFANSELNQDQYRQQRSILLADLTEIKAGTVSSARDFVATTEKPKYKTSNLFLFGAVGLLFLVSTVVVFWQGAERKGKSQIQENGHVQQEEKKNASAPVATTGNVVKSELLDDVDSEKEGIPDDSPQNAEGIIAFFLQQGDWSSDAVYALRERWSLLGSQESLQAKDLSWFIDFGETLKIYLDAQRERAALYERDADFSYLVELADHLGFVFDGKKDVNNGRTEVTESQQEVPIDGGKEGPLSSKKNGSVRVEAGSTVEAKQVFSDPPLKEGERRFTWEMPEIKALGVDRFVVVASFEAGEKEVFALVQENAELNLQPFRVDRTGQRYTIQKEFLRSSDALKFSGEIVDIFRNLQK